MCNVADLFSEKTCNPNFQWVKQRILLQGNRGLAVLFAVFSASPEGFKVKVDDILSLTVK